MLPGLVLQQIPACMLPSLHPSSTERHSELAAWRWRHPTKAGCEGQATISCDPRARVPCCMCSLQHRHQRLQPQNGGQPRSDGRGADGQAAARDRLPVVRDPPQPCRQEGMQLLQLDLGRGHRPVGTTAAGKVAARVCSQRARSSPGCGACACCCTQPGTCLSALELRRQPLCDFQV